MESLFHEFGEALTKRDGYQLSRTLSPNISNDRLRAIFKSCNANDVKRVLKTCILKAGLEKSSGTWEGLSADEIKGWVEIYFHYWRAIGELLAIQGPSVANGKVSISLHPVFIFEMPR